MNGFNKSRRLLTKSDYDYVFTQAQKVVTPHFIILYRDSAVGHARLGLALSKRMIAKAHDRNRLKRILREMFRTSSQLPAVDIIVLARSGVAKVDSAILMNKLGQAWNKLCDM
ncbi:MAG: ribonuclease P protein component [Legionellaceae bacterium]|nr:ribonuclease P protein component [Legionellaceae bacterium]